MTDMDYRISLTIPYPSYIPRQRGIHAVEKFGTYWKVKCSLDDFNLLNEAAAAVGVTRSEFIRWVAVKSAQEVLRNEHRNNAEHVEA